MTSILAFSPHPDDAELGCGGTLAKLAANGHQVILIDLTEGELGSLGTPEIRRQEAHAAANTLGIGIRENLKLPDGALDSHSRAQQETVVTSIRTHSPDIVFYPMDDGRHPDHREAELLVRDALFFCGLQNYVVPNGISHIARPQGIGYPTRNLFTPSFVVDVSAHYQKKIAAIGAYASQLRQNGGANTGVLISSPLTLPTIESRDALWGSSIGVSRGEGFFVQSPIRIDDPASHFVTSPLLGALVFPR